MKKILFLALIFPILFFIGCGSKMLSYSDHDKIKAKAERGNADAQYKLGLLYKYFGDNDSVTESEKETIYELAFKWYTKAAEQNYTAAWNGLGTLYEEGKGVPQDYQKAFEYYTKAAEHGSAVAKYNLAMIYFYGDGIERDYEKSIEWLTKSAEQNLAMAQNDLGTWYYEGKIVPQDFQKAVEWWTKAAKQGNEYAQKNLQDIKGKK